MFSAKSRLAVTYIESGKSPKLPLAVTNVSKNPELILINDSPATVTAH